MITRTLEIGDKVFYDKDPTIFGTVIGFRGWNNGIALLDTKMPSWVFPDGTTKGEQAKEFIWKFNVDGKGIITYNKLWTIIDE